MSTLDTSTSALQTTYINRKFLKRLEPKLQIWQFATKGSIPAGSGKTARWLHLPDFDADVTALSESTVADNEQTAPSFDSTEGDIANYGQWFPISELNAKTMVPTAMNEISDKMAFVGYKIVDTLLRDAAYTSTKTFHAGIGGTAYSGTIGPSGLKAADLNTIKGLLDADGNTGFDSLGGNYAAVLHPLQAAQLRGESATSSNVPTWSEQNKYVQGASNQGAIKSAQTGALFGISCFESSLITSGTIITKDSYKGIVIAQDGLGALGISDMKPMVKFKEPGANSTNDPLDIRYTIGVKLQGAFKLLSSSRVVVLYSSKSGS